MPKAGLHYRVVDNDQLNVEKNEWSESVGGTFMNVEATLNDVNLHYFIGDRNVDIGEARKIKLNLLIPDDDLFNHNWMYDGDTKVDLEDYKVTMNMVFEDLSH